jgi:hypothetical protein
LKENVMTSTATTTTSSKPVSLLRRVAAILVATAAMFIGFAVASSASTAHADTVAGDTVFGTTVECGGDELVFTVNSDADYGSFAQIWVYDTGTQEWVTDDTWVDADYSATYNIADLTFEPGYYMVYVSYAQWNGYDFDFSGEYISSYEQYYDYNDHETTDFCYMGNDLTVA